MNRPIYMHSRFSGTRRPSGYRVWVTSHRPDRRVSPDRSAWAKELAPEPEVLELLKDRRMSWGEFEAYYGARLRTAAAQDCLRALACLSQRRSLVLVCDCPEANHCFLPLLVRFLQTCRDQGDFRLSLANLSFREGERCL